MFPDDNEDALDVVVFGIERDLTDFHKLEKHYPRTMRLDTGANTLDLDVRNGSSTTSEDCGCPPAPARP